MQTVEVEVKTINNQKAKNGVKEGDRSAVAATSRLWQCGNSNGKAATRTAMAMAVAAAAAVVAKATAEGRG
jgi:hypothetical protein